MKPLIRRSDLSKPSRYYLLTRYRIDGPSVVASTKYDVTDEIEPLLSEARRLALAEGLDVERLARATRNAGYLFKRRDSRHQTPVYLEVAVEAIADEYARLTEEARHDPQ